MYSKKLILILFILTTIIFSCNDDTEQEPDIIPEISILELSSDFLFQGDILTITGENFINENHSTKIIVEDISYDIDPISNTKIEFNITDIIGFGKKNFKINISDQNSEQKSFFVMKKDWYNIREGRNIKKAFLHTNSSKITVLSSDSDNWEGYAYQLNTGNSGYFIENSNGSNTHRDIMMFNSEIGVSALLGGSVLLTTDGFNTTTYFPHVFSQTSWWYFSDKIHMINEIDFIISNSRNQHVRFTNQGETIETHFIDIPAGFIFHNYKIGKGTNGLYYEFGDYYDTANHSGVMSTLYSPNGFDNWTFLETLTPMNQVIMDNLFFYDYNLIYSVNENNELIKSTDLLQTWEFVQSDFDKFFMKTETEWYKVANDKLYYSNNSGSDWEFELDLPAGSQANYMDFEGDKVIIAGSSYLYIKHE